MCSITHKFKVLTAWINMLIAMKDTGVCAEYFSSWHGDHSYLLQTLYLPPW
jgi:hypothetical protein